MATQTPHPRTLFEKSGKNTWWPSLSANPRSFTSTCTLCMKSRPRRHLKAYAWPAASCDAQIATIATVDHNVPPPVSQDRCIIVDQISVAQVQTLRKNCLTSASNFSMCRTPVQGIVHMVGPEQGATKPGMTIVCGDSQLPPMALLAHSRSASARARSST